MRRARVMRSRRPPSFEEILLEAAKLLVEQVVGLVDEADEDVGDDLGRAGLEIGPIGLIGPI